MHVVVVDNSSMDLNYDYDYVVCRVIQHLLGVVVVVDDDHHFLMMMMFVVVVVDFDHVMCFFLFFYFFENETRSHHLRLLVVADVGLVVVYHLVMDVVSIAGEG